MDEYNVSQRQTVTGLHERILLISTAPKDNLILVPSYVYVTDLNKALKNHKI